MRTTNEPIDQPGRLVAKGKGKEMTKVISKMKVADLKPHPRQAANFPDLPDAQLRDLADDMERNGQKVPLEVLPDGTIVGGHQRWRAAKLLGWEEVNVWVNDELAAQGEAAVEQRLIEDNLNRRQLDRLEMARSYRRLQELADELPPGQRHRYQYGRLRDVLGRRLGMSGRTLDRLVRILDTPMEIQEAFRRGDLPVVIAEKVAGLPQEVQRGIAEELRQGGNAQQIVQAHLIKKGVSKNPVEEAFHQFVLGLDRGFNALDDKIDQIASVRSVASLKRGQSLIRRLLQKVESVRRGQRGKKRRGGQNRHP